MAKSKKGEKRSFSELNDFLNTIAPSGEIITKNPIAKIDEWIGSGSYILNAALSGSIFGGLPNRRSLVLAGEEGTGKTYIALSICRNAQKMGYNIIYFDSEGAIDTDFIIRLGVNPSNFRLQPVNTVEEFSHIAAQIATQCRKIKESGDEPPKFMVVLDSLGNLTSEKERDDTIKGDNKRDMTKQQAIRKLFRVNGLEFAQLGIPFIINNHIYDSMSMFSPKEISGGGGIKYNASIIFLLGKGKLEDAEGEKRAKEKKVDAVRVGVTIYVTPFKQRFARPIKVKLHIPFYKSPNPYVGLEDFVSWDSCGIIRGKCLSEKEWSKLSESEKEEAFPFPWEGETKYALPRDTARTIVCKHIGGEAPLVDLFSDRIFTQEVLLELDEKIIKPTFQLPSIESLEELKELQELLNLDPKGDPDPEENQ